MIRNPLTPELEALLGRSDEDATRLFRERRTRQVDGFPRPMERAR